MQRILESIVIALESIRANKLRSFMTVLGNIVAVTSIVTVVSLIQGMNAMVSRVIVTDVGGCAVDVDTEEEYDMISENFERWRTLHDARVEAVAGPLPLPAATSSRGSAS